ncbi:transportin-3 [Prunus yedoensis var. nudiflora]|uniref:Transportin-3 n=1 Tax=Prunus yedoensis var. nudiflora TaxID=2094558 RepID=A0A314Z738_PRUYE|nr:transportin-3 [Prunus yedoensis var. nudiflora]
MVGSAEDSLHLVEASSKVITELPPDHAKRALEWRPCACPSLLLYSQGPDTLNSKPARDLTMC